MPPKKSTGTPRRGRRSKAAVSESESVATSEPTSETQDEGETPIEVVDEKVETEVDAEKETMENEGNDGQNGDDESATKKQEEDSVGDQQESEELEQEGNEIEEEKDESDSEIIEENDDIQEIEEVEDINEKVDENKAVEKENDSNEMEIETNGNSTQEPVSKQQAAGKENNDHNESGVGIDMEEDNFEPDFEADDNNGSKNEEISMQADSEDEIEFLAEVEADRSEIEKQRKKAIAEELTLCLICHEICNRGIIVKCCSAHACRACAMKKVLVDKLCWVCPGAVTTQDLVNDDDIRSTVQLIKSEEAIPDENIKKLQARHFRTEKVRKALKEKTQNKEKKKKEFKKIAAPESDETEPQDNDPKSIEFKDAKKLFISLEVVFYGGERAVTQIGYTTEGETVFSPIVPKQDFLDNIMSERGQKIADKMHFSNFKTGSNGFIVGADFETEDGEIKNCWNFKQAFKKFEKYLQNHAKGEKFIFVFFTNIEHYTFSMFVPKDYNHLISKYCAGVMTYEDYAIKTGKAIKPVNVLAVMKNGRGVYSTDKLAECVSQVVGDIKDGKNCSIKTDFFSAKVPSVPEWGIFLYSSKFLDSKKIQSKQAAISTTISKTGQYGCSIVRFVCWEFNFPVLVKLFNIAADTTSIDYKGEFSNYICQGNSKVIRENNSCYALISMKLKAAIDQEKPKIRAVKPGLDVIDNKTAVITYTENSGLEDTEEESKPVKCDLVVVGATNVDINGATSVLVNIVPCSDESSFGDNISFGLEDVFVLARPSKSLPPGMVILNSTFSVVKEGKNMTRILLTSKQPTTISLDEPLATAYLYTRKEFPFLKKKILKESDFMDQHIPQITKPKELFTSKKAFGSKPPGSGRGNVKDRLSLPDRRGGYVNEFTSEKSSRRFNEDRQMDVNNQMNNMMGMMGNSMGMGMADMMNPMMNFMNMQQQQELNMMMMNQNSMNSMVNQNKNMMGHNKGSMNPPSSDLSRKRGFPSSRNTEQFDVPSKKSFSSRSDSDRRGYRRVSPEREKPSFGSGRRSPIMDDRAKRRGEQLEEEIAKYERELQLLKKMKELKEERSLLGSSSSRYGASSFSSASKYDDYSRSDSYSKVGGMSSSSRGGSLSRGGDESRYGRRDRSPMDPLNIGSLRDYRVDVSHNKGPYGEKRYGSGSSAFSSGGYTAASSARGGSSSFSSGRDKPLDTWSSSRQEGSSFGSSSRYDSGTSRSSGATGLSFLGIKPAGPADGGFKYDSTKSPYSAFPSSGDSSARFGSSSFSGSKSAGASSFGRGNYYGGTKSSFDSRR